MAIRPRRGLVDLVAVHGEVPGRAELAAQCSRFPHARLPVGDKIDIRKIVLGDRHPLPVNDQIEEPRLRLRDVENHSDTVSLARSPGPV